MRPILLKGHERPLTFLKYNLEGDLLVRVCPTYVPREVPGRTLGAAGHLREGSHAKHLVLRRWRAHRHVQGAQRRRVDMRHHRRAIFFLPRLLCFWPSCASAAVRRGALAALLTPWLRNVKPLPAASAADSLTLVTASADTTAKLWDVPTGTCYFTFEFDRQGARGCSFSLGAREVAMTLDPFMGEGSSVKIYRIEEDRTQRALLPRCVAAGLD